MSAADTMTGYGRELRDICGAGFVMDDPAQLKAYSLLGVAPAMAVTPGSADEIAAILRFANQHSLRVFPAGGFTQQEMGNPPQQADIVLLTTRLTAVEHYDPGDLTVGIGAGMTVGRLAAMVGEHQQLFAADPALPERCTVGGLLATATHGPLRHFFGGVRDFCIGVKFVTGDGRKAKGGGRVVKNVAGYDMMKLLIGSQGTLGVITGASFKLFPAPRQSCTFFADFAGVSEAIQFRNRILRSPLTPLCLEVVSPLAGEVLSLPSTEKWRVALRAAGTDAVLARYRAELGAAPSRDLDGAEETAFWRAVSDFAPVAQTRHAGAMVLSLGLPLSDVEPALGGIESIAAKNGLACAAVGRFGVGHLLAALWPMRDEPVVVENFLAAVAALRDGLNGGGSMTILRCPPELRARINVWGPTPTNVEAMRATKAALDPHDILNHGRFLL